ncbi:MAG: NUDIX domain-containing protein [bacterium]|nr:NUDIX domain-containing protein [Gammaproteobacteria bacterium]HIL96776.1 NUDIX domain-containing protein [Pseudomonadales bacterium]
MAIKVPEGSRPAARVLMIDESDRVLYLQACEKSSGRVFWVLPGGGLEHQESFEDAAIREVMEETGIEIELGPCLWTRHHVYQWMGKNHDQFEVFFASHVVASGLVPAQPDDYVVGHRWWSLSQLTASSESFAPTKIASLLAPILKGRYPVEAFDCGV